MQTFFQLLKSEFLLTEHFFLLCCSFSQHIEFSGGGSDSGYVCFIDPETAMKARAAVEFVGGLVVKNKFSVALEAVNGKVPFLLVMALLRK